MPLFMAKTTENPTIWDRTYLYSLYNRLLICIQIPRLLTIGKIQTMHLIVVRTYKGNML